VLTRAGENLEDIFGADGALADCLSGFAPRPEQLDMARAVADAIDAGRNLVIEAGTGTGKTLAYLVPSLVSGKRIIISTGTRTLQDQLYHRDLPMIGKALGRPVDVQLLKGRANYVCLYRLEGLEASFEGRIPVETANGIRHLREWIRRTQTGDVSEVEGVPEDSPLWPRVTSTVDNCLGSKCPRFADCHVVAARQAAREADLVVVNHHLLMADLTMKEEGFGDLLPGADTVIVDEAHHFPEVAQAFFNRTLGTGQVRDLIRDIRAEALAAGAYESELERVLDGVETAAADARLALQSTEGNVAWADAGDGFGAGFAGIREAMSVLKDTFDDLGSTGRSPGGAPSAGLERCRERVSAMMFAAEAILDTDEEEGLRWVKPGKRDFTANVTPLDASAEIESLLGARECAWVFTSATLAVGEDFRHFTNRIGIADISTLQIPSPFPYPDIARLYLPTGLPEPNTAEYTDLAVDAMAQAVLASRGRAFLLFTSHRALRRAGELLEARSDFDFPLLIQGTAPRSRLLERFARTGDAVLLGTATFWEGVDIRGHNLVLVAIDRLPFASPGDPMLAARLEAIRKRGGNPFREYQLPQAVLGLKQGVGRLIRDYDDYGVVMICDPRVSEKSYGRTFIASLPSMPMTRALDEIEDFFATREAGHE
jgi:ATP-dependent DNA helicase DinG